VAAAAGGGRRAQAGSGLLHALLGFGDRGGGSFLGETLGARRDALLFQHLAVALGGTVQAVGIATEAERKLGGDVVGQGLAERGEGGEFEGNELGGGDQADGAADAVFVQGFQGRLAGEDEVAVGRPEEHRGEEDEDKVEKDVGRGGGGLGHWAEALGWVSGILPLVVTVVKKYFLSLEVRG
jgi:hypothetical protein